MAESNVERVRRGFAAAMRGDLDVIEEMLAPDVRWHGAGDDAGGCQNRRQAMVWIGEAIARGIRVEVVEAKALGGDRVLVLLQRNQRRDGDPPGEQPAPHAQIVTFNQGQVVEMVVYPSPDEALDAAGIA
jgi:ketosteroid isomerase-like protein